ncbi:helix-turn-helix domain-containing protein [Lactiplantibacillus pentosus]|jgi:transcriptional regulator with XRE-family HTH domain|uniref:helix-turn-helix domain-containing protein n=1 Tax=Lactiplantibacillus pentosus TaxID=1589 RepID=UPI0021823EF0|nr:helix-turn-helix transcriptional regulator [Lactiplantibacillus pentosus]MCH4056400.1 helix-turn-helix domain-containing protein [Lactobacillaceae bacterium]MCT0162040.1 XRE family transcriptional regulator [Lactiplantibacillus pentosus]
MNFGENLQKLRKERGLTQQELADMVGINLPNFSKIERGISAPSFATTQNLIKALMVTPNELMMYPVEDEDSELQRMAKSVSDTDRVIGLRIKKIISKNTKTLKEAVNLFDQPQPSEHLIKQWEYGITRPDEKCLKQLAELSKDFTVEELLLPDDDNVAVNSIKVMNESYLLKRSEIKQSLSSSYIFKALFEKYVDMTTLEDGSYVKAYENILFGLNEVLSSDYYLNSTPRKGKKMFTQVIDNSIDLLQSGATDRKY